MTSKPEVTVRIEDLRALMIFREGTEPYIEAKFALCRAIVEAEEEASKTGHSA